MKLSRMILPHLLLFIIFPLQTELESVAPNQQMKSERDFSKESQRELLNVVHDYNSSRSNK